MRTLSLIIPYFNDFKTIGNCLDSIFIQDIPDDWKVDVIVVDDASRISCKEYIKNHLKNIHLVVNEINLGPAKSRNRGVNESNGELIAFVDADVELGVDWIKNAIYFMEKTTVAGGQGKIVPSGDGMFDRFRKKLISQQTKEVVY